MARVRVKFSDGATGTVEEADVPQVTAQGGEVVHSWRQRAAAAVRDTAEGQAANLVGGLRGLTGGMSDRLPLEAADLVGQKEPLRKALNKLKEDQPFESQRGEVGGVVLPMLLEGKGAGEPWKPAAPEKGALAPAPEGAPAKPWVPSDVAPAKPLPEPGPAGLPEKGPLITPDTNTVHTPEEAAKFDQRAVTEERPPFPGRRAAAAEPPRVDVDVDWDHPDAAAPRNIETFGRAKPLEEIPAARPTKPNKNIPPEPTEAQLEETNPGRRGAAEKKIEEVLDPEAWRTKNPWAGSLKNRFKILRPEGGSVRSFAEARALGADATLPATPFEPGAAPGEPTAAGLGEPAASPGEPLTPENAARKFSLERELGGEHTRAGIGEPPPRIPERGPAVESVENTKTGLGEEPAPASPPEREVTKTGLGEELTQKYEPRVTVGDPDVDPFGRTRFGRRPPMPEQPFPTATADAYAPESSAHAASQAAGEAAVAGTEVGHAAGATYKPPSILDALPPNITAELGNMVERQILRDLGPEAKTALGRMLQQATAQAGRGALEGGIYGALQQLDEDALGDHKTNAAKLLAAMGHGALWGGGIGAGVGASGVLARSVAGQVARSLESQKGKMAWKALFSGSNKRATRAAESIPGGVTAIGNYLLEKKLVQAGDNIEKIEPRIAAALEQKGEDIGVIIDAHDAAGLKGGGMSERAFVKLSNLKRELSQFPELNRGAINEIERVQRDMIAIYERNGKMTFRDAWEMRGRIDKEAKFNQTPWSPHNERSDTLKQMRRIFEGEIEQAIDTSGSKLGPAYQEAKLEYRMLKTASKTVKESITSKLSNRGASLTDYLAGLAAVAAGHPVIGAISGAAHHVVKDRGNATAAALLDKLATLEGVRRASAHVDRQIGRGVGAIFERGRAEMALKDPVLRGDHDARVLAVAKAITDGSHVEAIEQAALPIMTHAPETGAAFMQQAMRVTQYLAAKLPQDPTGPSLTPQHDKIEWNDMEKADFARAVDIAHDPVSILREINNGDVTEDQVEGIRTMYPELYKEMREEMEYELAQTKPHELPYDKQLAIGIFMQHADPTMERSFIAAMQQAFPPPPQGAPGGGKKHGGRHKSVGQLGFIANESLVGGDNKPSISQQ